MRAAIIALILTFGSQARAGCPDLCDENWWERATTADVQAELAGGVDVMERDQDGYAPLHGAAYCLLECRPGVIQALLAAGADAKAKNKEDKTPWEIAQGKERMKGTKGYWVLNDAQFK